MNIEERKITIRELINNYIDNEEEGVYGYNGQLNIRPKYQREFIYKDKQRDAVLETIKMGMPLGTIYWAKSKDNNFELLDGQQRTLSICKYIAGDFSICFRLKTPQYWHNLSPDEQEKILNYQLAIYICDGTDDEKLAWFQRINIAGVQLTNQELRNAIYAGAWLTDAKRYFSKSACPAYEISKKYIKGQCNRQDYLETAIKWISNNNIEEYMSTNQHKKNATEMWLHFKKIIDWIDVTFPNYRKEMEGVNWGEIYNEYGHQTFDDDLLEEKVKKLMLDDDITKKQGIYLYIFNNNERLLSIRSFDKRQKRQVFENQNGVCVHCKNTFKIEEMEADHIKPWSQGGQTITENCQMLCKQCNRTKAGK